MKKFFLLSLLAILGVIVTFNTLFAFTVWVDAHGKPCDVVCKNEGLKPVVAGTYINGENFYVCSGNAGGEGFRPGYNLRPGWADRCVVGWGGRELSVKPYKCLCEGKEYRGAKLKRETKRKQNVFYYPKIKGYRLDWCRLWATDCGKGAADAFCRLKGYAGAESWEIDPDIGLHSPTYVIGSGQICNQSFCDGFKYIVCFPKKRPPISPKRYGPEEYKGGF